jgi:hypothetical protein
MVTFILVKKNGAHLIYWYYPEGNEALKPGIIEVDLDRTEIKVTELAEEDWERNISPEELNEVVEAINRMKRERGDTDIVELATEAERSIFYGDHAVSEICKHLKNGEIPEKGIQAWY